MDMIKYLQTILYLCICVLLGGMQMYSPNEIAKNVVEIGRNKAEMRWIKLFCLGIMAGIFIALASVGANTAASMLENPVVAKLVSACVFPVGLAMILIAGGELFTGNNLMVIAVLEKKTSIFGLLKNWLMVYLGNLVGSVFVAYIAFAGGQLDLFKGAVAVKTIEVAVSKVSLSFPDALLLGILCNILVCTAVWMSYGAKSVGGKIAAIYLPVMLFVLAGTEHCVANMYYISAGLFAKLNPEWVTLAGDKFNADVLTWGSFFGKNLLPVTLGNIIGGAVIVGGMYWLIYLRGSKKTEKTPVMK